MLNSIKLDVTIIIIIEKYFVTTSFFDHITNRAYNPIKNDNIEEVRWEIGSYECLEYKTLHITQLKTNQIKVNIDQCLIINSA